MKHIIIILSQIRLQNQVHINTCIIRVGTNENMNSVVSFFVCFVLVYGSADEESILCGPKSCNDITCPELPEKCKIQNSTHNGIFLPSLEICDCCQYCLENLNEGEACTIGNPSASISTSICGPGLTCKLLPNKPYDGTCQKMETDCVKSQISFDERRKIGTLGKMEFRKSCDGDGKFLSFNCIPGESCYCIDENGTRIFGEMDFTSLPEVDLQCKCSRDVALGNILVGKELNPSEHFRCTANGDYDTFQRIGDKFLCVDASDGAPTYPEDFMVNSTLATKLKCYHKGEGGDMYYKKCEKEYADVLKEVEKYDYDIVFGYTYPKCDLDGTYQAVQENLTHSMCVDKQGNVLLALDKNNSETADLIKDMDCKCARASLVMTAMEKPTCKENGNYDPTQCRRGSCRCVDGDGNQVCTSSPCEIDEVDKKASLKCK